MKWRLASYPFFENAHLALAERLADWTPRLDALEHDRDKLEDSCRQVARDLAEAGFLDLVVPLTPQTRIDVRSICLAREAIAYRSGLADAVFAMQGIGTAALWSHPSAEFRERYLLPCRQGRALAAFAVTELDVGSDIAATATVARRERDEFVLNGSKAWISNAGIADHYVIVARTGEENGSQGLSAFLVERDTPGLHAGPQLANIGDHPLGNLRLDNCRVPASALVSAPGAGFAATMAMFNVFRTSVGAAALGMARRALDETLARVKSRTLFGAPMSRLGAVEQRIAEMVADTETAALHVYQAAWLADRDAQPVPGAASLAKLSATEAAFRVVDAAVQMFGALGVAQGSTVERLYREIRPLRIYEGASEVQKLIIARQVLRGADKERAARP
jgi:acyl-CoA dehydrogenase